MDGCLEDRNSVSEVLRGWSHSGWPIELLTCWFSQQVFIMISVDSVVTLRHKCRKPIFLSRGWVHDRCSMKETCQWGSSAVDDTRSLYPPISASGAGDTDRPVCPVRPRRSVGRPTSLAVSPQSPARPRERGRLIQVAFSGARTMNESSCWEKQKRCRTIDDERELETRVDWLDGKTDVGYVERKFPVFSVRRVYILVNVNFELYSVQPYFGAISKDINYARTFFNKLFRNLKSEDHLVNVFN